MTGRFLTAALLLVGAPVCFVPGAWAQGLSSEVDNQTRSLSVSNLVANNGLVHLLLTNNGSRIVRAFSVKVRDLVVTHDSYPPGENGIASGGSYDFTFMLPSADAENSGTVEVLPRLSVLAVFFADGSSEGDPATIADIKAQRRGTAIQLQRAIPLLASISEVPDKNLHQALSVILDRIATLPETLDSGERPGHFVLSGLKGGRTMAASGLSDLLHSGGSAQPAELRARIASRVDMLRTELSALQGELGNQLGAQR